MCCTLYGHQRHTKDRTHTQINMHTKLTMVLYRLNLICTMGSPFFLSCWYRAMFNIKFYFQSEIVGSSDFDWLYLFLLLPLHFHNYFTLGLLFCKIESKINAWPLPLQIAMPPQLTLSIAQADVSLGDYIFSFLRQLWKINLKGKTILNIQKKLCYTFVCMYDLKRISCNLKYWRLLSQNFIPVCGSLNSLLP